MSSVSHKNFRECPVCLDQAVKVSLSCHKKHRLCLTCAIKIFGEMSDGQVTTSKPCPLCTKLVTAYTAIHLQKSKAKVDQVFENQNQPQDDSKQLDKPRFKSGASVGATLGSMIDDLQKQGYTDDQIKAYFNRSYEQYKRPLLFWPV